MECPHCQTIDNGILVLYYEYIDECIKCIICGYREYKLLKEVK